MTEAEYFVIQPWHFNVQSEVEAVAQTLNHALAKNVDGSAATAVCDVKFFVEEDTDSNHTGWYWIACKSPGTSDGHTILKIEAGRGSGASDTNVGIVAFSNNGTFLANCVNASSESGNPGDGFSMAAGMYVVAGRKGFALSAGLAPASSSYPIIISNDIFSKPAIAWLANVSSSRYVCAANPSYPNNSSSRDNLQVYRKFEATRPENSVWKYVPSEMLVPMQIPTSATSNVLTDVCYVGMTTNIPTTYYGEVSIKDAGEGGGVKRYWTYGGWVFLRLFD